MKTPIEMMMDGIEFYPIERAGDCSSDFLYATHKGVLKIGDVEVDAYILSDGQRILSGPAIEAMVNGLKDL